MNKKTQTLKAEEKLKLKNPRLATKQNHKISHRHHFKNIIFMENNLIPKTKTVKITIIKEP